jgi:hypothetical protein
VVTGYDKRAANARVSIQLGSARLSRRINPADGAPR